MHPVCRLTPKKEGVGTVMYVPGAQKLQMRSAVGIAGLL